VITVIANCFLIAGVAFMIVLAVQTYRSRPGEASCVHRDPAAVR
jgi:hypothetical protein